MIDRIAPSTAQIARSVMHDIVVVERVFDAPPARVFTAFTKLDARLRWSVPQGEKLEYLESSFTIGGRDVFRCGRDNDMCFLGDIRYEDIVPDKRIVSTENLSRNNIRLSVALTTIELVPEGNGTRMIMTAQIAEFDGSNMSSGYRHGWQTVLDNLVIELRKP